jgi:hypothetical protein
MPHYPALKVVGWTSSYKSVQKLLKWLRKQKCGEDINRTYLDSIHFLCQCLGKNPDEVVALAKSSRWDVTDTFSSAMKKAGMGKQEQDIRLAQVITFLSKNRAF